MKSCSGWFGEKKEVLTEVCNILKLPNQADSQFIPSIRHTKEKETKANNLFSLKFSKEEFRLK